MEPNIRLLTRLALCACRCSWIEWEMGNKICWISGWMCISINRSARHTLKSEDVVTCGNGWFDPDRSVLLQDLHRTGTSVDNEWPDFASWARQHGSDYSDVAGLYGDARRDREMDYSEKEREEPVLDDRDSGIGSNLSHRERRDTESHGPRPKTPTTPAYGHSTSIDNRAGHATGSPFSQYQQEHAQAGGSGMNGPGERDSNGRFGDRRVSAGPTVSRRNQVVTQLVLFTSAERIYARYMMDNAEKPVYFP